MGSKWIIILVFAVVLTVSVPFFVAKNLQLGNYAKSPQEVQLTLGGTTVIAGGRAKLWFAGGETGADFEIQCSRQFRYCQPTQRFQQFDGCGVTVEMTELDDTKSPYRAKFKVSWEEKKD